MKVSLIAVVIMFFLNIIFTGIIQNGVRRVGVSTQKLETLHAAELSRHTVLTKERQELIKRDRIVSYAQQNLGMQLLKPDQIANNNIIREIREDTGRQNSIVYSFIDFITPTMSATTR